MGRQKKIRRRIQECPNTHRHETSPRVRVSRKQYTPNQQLVLGAKGSFLKPYPTLWRTERHEFPVRRRACRLVSICQSRRRFIVGRVGRVVQCCPAVMSFYSVIEDLSFAAAWRFTPA